MLPEAVLALLTGAFRATPPSDIAPTVGGRSNLTVALAFGQTRAIVKAATTAQKRSDLRREGYLLGRLATTGLPIPRLITMLEDEHWTLEVLERLPGENALGLLSGPLAPILELYQALGALLAQLHHLAIPPPAAAPAQARHADTPPLRHLDARVAAAVLPGLGLPSELAAPLAVALEYAALPVKAPCLTHGDPGAHNLLWGNGRLALLDWEWAGWGDPLADLAWVCWTIRFRRLPHGVQEALFTGYGAPPLDQRLQRKLELAQIGMILSRVADQPAARDEWLRRLRWTLAGG